jgi:hypothetical protein
LDVQFYPREGIPEGSLGNRTTVRQIEDAYAALADPSLPTVFD